jgi:hypothetical protein
LGRQRFGILEPRQKPYRRTRHKWLKALVTGEPVLRGQKELFFPRAGKSRGSGRPKYSITQKFKEFLRIHVPGVESRFLEEFAAIYKTRYSIAHGEVMLMADLRPWQFFGDTLQQWQAKFQRNTYRIIALRNWVLAAPTAAKRDENGPSHAT